MPRGRWLLTLETIVVNKLLRSPSAVARDPAVDAWFDSRCPPLGAIAREWFLRMRNCGSDVGEWAYIRHVQLTPGTAVDATSLEALMPVAHLDIKTRMGAT